jgi:glucose-6-phosphate 1-dehydrogenase
MKKYGYINRSSPKKYKIIIEKPFGNNLPTAKLLNRQLCSVFKEDEIYRIDHYLGKESVQNLFALRFANKLFESGWNSKNIENIQITVSEKLGVERRGEYYDRYGALKDMVQNHLLQILTLISMEPPKSFTAKEIKAEKVKVLKAISFPTKSIVFGQYVKGRSGTDYRNEPEVNPSSRTETYVALKAMINNKRWKNMPFYLRTGKNLNKKFTEIIVNYKSSNIDVMPNVLIIRLQPEEGILLKFNIKEPGNKFEIKEVNMDFCHECMFRMNSPEAYEKLLYDTLLGDTTLFTRWDEAEYAWKLIDPIAKNWKNKRPFSYRTGSFGPKEADKILEKGHKWRNP